MFKVDDQQLKDLIASELDVIQFLDLIDMSFQELLDVVFENGLTPEQVNILEETLR
jgi:hypothetical protein